MHLASGIILLILGSIIAAFGEELFGFGIFLLFLSFAVMIIGEIVRQSNSESSYQNTTNNCNDPNLYTVHRVTMKHLLANATNYANTKVSLATDVIITFVDREREMLKVCPVCNNNALGYDWSFELEIKYSYLPNRAEWSVVSIQDNVRLTKIIGYFQIYSDCTNEGYIIAEQIG